MKEYLFAKYDTMTEEELNNLYDELAQDTSILWNAEDAECDVEEFYILCEYLQLKEA